MSASRIAEQVGEEYRNRLRECRLRALIGTQCQLSQLTGIRPGVINRWEKNRSLIPIQFALVLSKVLGCRVDELYTRREVTK